MRIRSLDLYGLEKTCAFLEELDRLQVKNFFISCNFARTTFSAADFVGGSASKSSAGTPSPGNC